MNRNDDEQKTLSFILEKSSSSKQAGTGTSNNQEGRSASASSDVLQRAAPLAPNEARAIVKEPPTGALKSSSDADEQMIPISSSISSSNPRHDDQQLLWQQEQELSKANGTNDSRKAEPQRTHLPPQSQESIPGAIAVGGSGASTTVSNLNDSSSNNHIGVGVLESTVITSAFPVIDPETTREELAREIRQSILMEAVPAVVLGLEEGQPSDPEEDTAPKYPCSWSKTMRILAGFTILLVVLVPSILVGIVRTDKGESGKDEVISSTITSANTTTTVAPTNLTIMDRPTLELVRERGHVRCGVSDGFAGFTNTNPTTGQLEGINVDQCRAISIAVFGNPDQVELVMPPKGGHPSLMLSGEDKVDVVCQYVSKRMAPDLTLGVRYSMPYFFSGFGFVGDPFFVDCAEKLDSLSTECRPLRLCVGVGTVNEEILQEIFPGGKVVPCDGPMVSVHKLASGECNVLATQPATASEGRFQKAGYQGNFSRGTKLFSVEAVSLMTPDDNSEWSGIVDLVINTFFLAESYSITQSNANNLRSILHTEDSKHASVDAMVAIIAEFGSYGDLYGRHLQSVVPRQGVNHLYNASSTSSGLLYSLAFRQLNQVGPSPRSNATIHTILARGYIRCGTHPRPQLEARVERAWYDLDCELCRALAAGLFAGDRSAVEFVKADEYNSTSLTNGKVDIMSGQRVNLRNLLDGFVYGKPYFVEPETMTQFALMTRGDDSQWSSFVDWMTMAIIYAEEVDIDQRSFASMPITSLFGEELKHCLQDCILAVGNYAELYNRTLMTVLPRSNPNMLNLDNGGKGSGPQHSPLPLH